MSSARIKPSSLNWVASLVGLPGSQTVIHRLSRFKSADRFSVRTLLFILSILIILVSVLLFLSKRKAVIQAAWWDENWMYRRRIPVTNNTNQETDVYISLTLDTSDTSRFQTDCGDIRFIKENGEPLPYYIVSGCGTTTTTIHVNFDVFPAGSQNIYVYYGNPSAENGFSSSD